MRRIGASAVKDNKKNKNLGKGERDEFGCLKHRGERDEFGFFLLNDENWKAFILSAYDIDKEKAGLLSNLIPLPIQDGVFNFKMKIASRDLFEKVNSSEFKDFILTRMVSFGFPVYKIYDGIYIEECKTNLSTESIKKMLMDFYTNGYTLAATGKFFRDNEGNPIMNGVIIDEAFGAYKQVFNDFDYDKYISSYLE